MVLSTMVVLDKLDINFVEKASALPGVDEWGYPTQTTTENLVYDADTVVNISVNTTGLTSGVFYYLYYPHYERDGSTYTLTWRPYMSSGAQKNIYVTSPGTDEDLNNIYLNRSGLWVLNRTEETGVPSAANPTDWSNTVHKWFWVNSSETISLMVDPDEVYYGNNETIQLTVEQDGAGVDSWVDVRRERNGVEVGSFPQLANGGSLSFSSSWMTRLQWAGNYTVVAWRDLDEQTPLYQSYGYGYNESFGSTLTATRYNYSIAGPWDPPEYNVSYSPSKLVCNPGIPVTSVAEGNQTMYWSFEGEVNISAEDYDENNITSQYLNVYVYNSDDENVTATANLTISISASGHWITIYSPTWGKNESTVIGDNGTWYAYLWLDKDGDRDSSAPDTHQYTEEWNTTVEWTVTTAPGAQFKWIDDDGNLGSDNNDGEIPMVPALNKQPVNISFQIIGRDHSYYGAGGTVATMGENITVSGDALFLSSKTLDEFPGAWFDGTSTWYINITPIMALNGGMITISATWKGNGTVSEDLYIGGNKYNGTIVTMSPTEFPIDENVTITVTVTDAVNAGYGYTNAEVYLRWVEDGTGAIIDTAAGLISDKLGGGTSSGTYEFLFNRTMQKDNQTAAYGAIRAPRNISAYVKLYRGGTPSYIYGYALAVMKPISDLKVTCEPNVVMAGEKISKLYLNTTTVDSAGNESGWPEDSGLKVRIYNETGDDVTDSIGNIASGTGTKGTDGKANKTASNVYLQEPGTYTIHAYNNTHNSEGYNATLVVVPVDVSSSIEEIIWGVDKNISTTFTVTYDGQPLNGTLRVDNISDAGDYNKTWTNCSFSPTIGSTTGTDAKNTSKELKVINGEVTLNNITANNLSEFLDGKWKHYSRQNITFYFKPKTSGSAWAKANGMVPVKIANVQASPASIPYNKPAEVTLTVSGRDTGLENVWVSMIIPGLTGELNTTTDENGEALFAFTPPTTGEIEIRVENRTSETKIRVTSWSLYLDVDSQANEGVSFTITVRNATAAGAALADAAVTFNRETKTTDSSGQVTFTAPAVTVARQYTIVATKDGYAEASEDILILNIPKLTIVVVGEVAAGSTFDVVIADDAGNAVVGATITINEDVYTTGAQGIATITAPSEEGTYTITATFPGYTDADPITIKIEAGGIPGFELLTLIAALGVAFILLRRRRRN